MLRSFFAWCMWVIVAMCGVICWVKMEAEPLLALGCAFLGFLMLFVAIAATWWAIRHMKEVNARRTTEEVSVAMTREGQRPFDNDIYQPMWSRGEPFDYFGGQDPVV